MNIRDFLFDEMKKDASLYALVTAFEISNVDIEEPILIDCIKNPENDTFFRRLGMVSDYMIEQMVVKELMFLMNY